ncbi:MAG TPA: glycerate kinase [Planctomycetota bacterium]|nr:glycerate kinase [Planctomycetota bacterium]
MNSQNEKTAPRVVVACATFKGTLSSKAAGEAIARGLHASGASTSIVVLADGGEGLVDALASQVPGALRVGAAARGPLQAPRTAAFAILPKVVEGKGELAVIEMAASSGLNLISDAERDPKLTTSLGVGDQILAALEHETSGMRILLGLGGSATNDGGAGMAQALGVRFLDVAGKELESGGAALARLAHIDISKMNTRARTVPVTVACDVRNPLCGPEGATYVFGRQKGATPDDQKILDAALAHYAEIIKKDLGKDVATIPGAGAAGGLGAGCLAFLNATLKPGIELVLDTLKFDAALAGASLVITGEGMLDDQTLMGKAPAGVAGRAARQGIRCIAIGGGIDRQHEAALKKTFSRLESLSDFAGSKEAAMFEPARWLENLAKTRLPEWLQ